MSQRSQKGATLPPLLPEGQGQRNGHSVTLTPQSQSHNDNQKPARQAAPVKTLPLTNGEGSEKEQNEQEQGLGQGEGEVNEGLLEVELQQLQGNKNNMKSSNKDNHHHNSNNSNNKNSNNSNNNYNKNDNYDNEGDRDRDRLPEISLTKKVASTTLNVAKQSETTTTLVSSSSSSSSSLSLSSPSLPLTISTSPKTSTGTEKDTTTKKKRSNVKSVEVVETKVKKKGNSKVFIRIRPVVRDGGGHDQNGEGVAKVLDTWDEKSVTINTAYMFSEGATIYKFPEKVLGPEVDQELMYNTMLPDYVSSFTALEGHNVVFLAYGQTGTGKTHTMFGTDDSLKISNPDLNAIDKDWGILPRVVVSTFQICNARSSSCKFFLIASAVEFYLGQCYDLLDGHKVLDVDMATSQPLGMEFMEIENMNHLFQYIKAVKQMRTSCNTKMNQASDQHEGSSRSHCALILRLYNLEKESKKFYQTSFTLLDLAGAERPNKVGVSERKTKKEVSKAATSSSSSSSNSNSTATTTTTTAIGTSKNSKNDNQDLLTSGPLMAVWTVEGERQRGNDILAVQMRAQANQPEYLAMQAQLINFELQELRTLALQASEAHKANKKYSPPTSNYTQAIRFVASNLDGSCRTGMVITLSQAPQNGWETWFSLNYGTTLAEIEVKLKKRKTLGKLQELIKEAEKDKENKAQEIAVEPAEGHPSRKYYGKKVAMFKEAERFLRILNLFIE